LYCKFYENANKNNIFTHDLGFGHHFQSHSETQPKKFYPLSEGKAAVGAQIKALFFAVKADHFLGVLPPPM
jgi:hypothetical protein